MDARERLRAYLEQRRELGESEFVLDSMSVEDALGAIDKLRSRQPETPRTARAAPPRTAAPARSSTAQPAVVKPAPQRREPEQLSTARSVRITERAPDVSIEPTREHLTVNETTQPDDEEPAIKDLAQGLVVGNTNGTLFEQNPFHGVRTLDSLAKLIEECTRCPLYETAKHAVPGEGDPNADFMCVGEAPGANEDETGRPFVGQAGSLLTKILAAIDLTREQVFIANVLKHRPPGNRNPQPDEVAACEPYLVRQIQLVKPKVILALGTFAAQTLLATKTPIGKLRGAIHRYYGIPLIVTYHPAALLRNPAWKRPTWEDVKLARHILDTSKS
jgi:uracil-DNA glycosylase family 4